MPAKTLSLTADASRAAKTAETANLDMIAVNLRSSGLQVALSSAAILLAFDGRITGFGDALTLWHFGWLAAQIGIGVLFFAVCRLWPRGAATGPFGVSRRTAYTMLYLLSGASWGALTWVAIIPGDIYNQVFVILIIMCLSMVYIVRLTACTPVFFAGCAGLFAVAMPNCWVVENGLSVLLTIAMPVWLTLLGVAAWRLGSQISEMIEMRLREGDLAARLSEAYARAEAESASKSAFLANMSHELRTPLNAIIGFSDVMRSGLFGDPGARYKDYADDIHASGEHLLSLINDVLDIAKIEAGHMQLAIEPVDAADIAPQVMRLLKPRADEKRQTLNMSLAGAPAMMMADPRALTQIVLNVAGNAVKYTQTGGTISIALLADGRDVVIRVSDNGPCIAPDQQKRLFKPFERLDNSYVAGDSGTGLGLALVRELAALHGGDASIESRDGIGTTITVRLPGAVIPSGKARAA